jgi:hypothetical protein
MWYRWRNAESDVWRKAAFVPIGEQVVAQLFLHGADADESDPLGISSHRQQRRPREEGEAGSDGLFEFEVSEGRGPVVLIGIEVVSGSKRILGRLA